MFIRWANSKIVRAGRAPKDIGFEIPQVVLSAVDPIRENPEDYIYTRNWAISALESHGANDNGDGFPRDDLIKSGNTFLRVPVTVDHDGKRAVGLVIGTMWNRMPDVLVSLGVRPDLAWKELPFELERLYLRGDTLARRAMLLKLGLREEPKEWIQVARAYPYDFVTNVWAMEKRALEDDTPGLTEAILAGEVTDSSMGCFVEESECSVCANKAKNESEYCEHVKNYKGKLGVVFSSDVGPQDVYEINRGITFFEDSVIVPTRLGGVAGGKGADPNARVEVIAHKTKRPIEQYMIRRTLTAAGKVTSEWAEELPNSSYMLGGKPNSVTKAEEKDRSPFPVDTGGRDEKEIDDRKEENDKGAEGKEKEVDGEEMPEKTADANEDREQAEPVDVPNTDVPDKENSGFPGVDGDLIDAIFGLVSQGVPLETAVAVIEDEYSMEVPSMREDRKRRLIAEARARLRKRAEEDKEDKAKAEEDKDQEKEATEDNDLPKFLKEDKNEKDGKEDKDVEARLKTLKSRLRGSCSTKDVRAQIARRMALRRKLEAIRARRGGSLPRPGQIASRDPRQVSIALKNRLRAVEHQAAKRAELAHRLSVAMASRGMIPLSGTEAKYQEFLKYTPDQLRAIGSVLFTLRRPAPVPRRLANSTQMPVKRTNIPLGVRERRMAVLKDAIRNPQRRTAAVPRLATEQDVENTSLLNKGTMFDD